MENNEGLDVGHESSRALNASNNVLVERLAGLAVAGVGIAGLWYYFKLVAPIVAAGHGIALLAPGFLALGMASVLFTGMGLLAAFGKHK